MSRQKKIQLENGTILFLGAAAFILLAASLFPSSAMSQKVRSYLEMNRMVERAFAVMLLVLSTQLMKRKRTARRRRPAARGNQTALSDNNPPRRSARPRGP